MPEILTESFCERCGTRYTFESAAPRGPRLRGLKVMSRGLRNFVMSDDASMDEAMAAARSEADREVTSQQLEAFHQTFNFCMSCRQYTCSNCWNVPEGRCLSCSPMYGEDGVSFRLPTVGAGGAVTLTGPEAVELQDRNGHGVAAPEPLAWPTEDLMREQELPPEGLPTSDLDAASTAPTDETDSVAQAPPVDAAAPEDAIAAAAAYAEAEHEAAWSVEEVDDAEQPVVAISTEQAIEPKTELATEAAIELDVVEAEAIEAVDTFEQVDVTSTDADFRLVRDAEVARDFEPLPDFEPADEIEVPYDLEPIDFAARFGTITGTETEATEPPAPSSVELAGEEETEAIDAETAVVEGWAAEREPTPVDEPAAPLAEPPVDDLAAAAAANTTDLLWRFRVDDDGAATEPTAAESTAEEVPGAVAPTPTTEPEPVVTEPEPVAAAVEPFVPEPEPVAFEPEPEPVVAEPEPVAFEPEPEPVVAEPEPVPFEPEPEPAVADLEPVVAEPEPVVAQPEPLAFEPEPVVAEPEAVVAEPEPVVAEAEPVVAEPETVVAEAEPVEVQHEPLEPEPVAATSEPEPEIVAPREDLVAQPTWQIVAPEAPTADGLRPPLVSPAAPPAPAPTDAVQASAAPQAGPEPAPQPQWPDRQPTPGLPFLDRPAAATGGIEALWAESAREVASTGPAPGTRTGIQPCVNCGLSLSANARFCRRCGTRQA